jgi:hypothetical protein
MAFNFFKKATALKVAETPVKVDRAPSLAHSRKARIGRDTRVMALAAHIGQAGQKSRIGLPNWSA